jgi:environmental stress-induced protein Ves
VVELLKPSEYRRQRWKNGGGVTDEIAADAESPPAWRISIATIERDGPFSDFRGYDRTIVALDERVTLTIDGVDVPLRLHEPFDFRGESTVEAHVGATARDLNVMTLRTDFAHDVEILRTPQRYLVDEDELVFAYVLCGEATVSDLHCTAGETAYLDEVERFDIVPAADSAVCVIHITPR